ncbi:MAG: hypothetical protein WAO20_06355 [Acidobacteriota bacterium]
MKRVLAFGVLLATTSLSAFTVNFSGKWEIQTDSDAGGRGIATVLTLNQAGDEVTGTIAVPPEPWTNSPRNDRIWDGRVEGSTLSFYVWTGTDQPEKSRYRGTLSASGDEIVFEITQGQAATAVADADSQPTRQVTARRVP